MLSDRGLLYFAVFARSVATGMIGVLFGIYLSELHLSTNAIGFIVSTGLAGAAVATLLATLYADVTGHRRTLFILTLSSFAGAMLLTFSAHPFARTSWRLFDRKSGHSLRASRTSCAFGGWALAPAVAGVLMSGASLAVPLFVGAGMKIIYDFALWRSFRGLRPPEECA